MLKQVYRDWSIGRIRPLVVAAFLIVAFPSVAADINEAKSFAIKPQPMDTALIDFSKQAGFQVVAESSDVSKFQTRGVVGKHPIGEALDQLLSGSGLSYRVIGADVITIEKASGKSRGGAPEGRSEISGHLAQSQVGNRDT